MSTLTLNASLCHGCGTCASECPGFITMTADNHPALNPTAKPNCIGCYHCVAVCPHGAIAIDNVTPEKCRPVDQNLIPTAEQAFHIVRARRSFRVFDQQPVEQQKILDLIDIARHAPTARNSQQVSYIVVNSPQKVKHLAQMVIDYFKSPESTSNPTRNRYARYINDWDAGYDAILRSAPCLIVAIAPSDYKYGVVDSAIALTCIDNSVLSFNLGACWAGIFMNACESHAPLRQALSLPPSHVVTGALMVGAPLHAYLRIPPRNPAKITWL